MFARLRAFRDALIHRRRFESDMEAEMRFHIEAFAADLVRAGTPRAEAERQARVEFGPLAGVKEECRQSLGLRLVEEVRQDLAYAARGLRRSPGFAAAAVASLALAIGANTVIFSFVNGIAIKPYPYRDSSRLVRLFQGTRQVSSTPRELLDLRERHDVFSDLAARAIFTTDATVSGAALPASEHTTAVAVTANYFEVLGTQPSLGRGFLPEENQPGRSAVAILSNRFWRERRQLLAGIRCEPAAALLDDKWRDIEPRIGGIARERQLRAVATAELHNVGHPVALDEAIDHLRLEPRKPAV